MAYSRFHAAKSSLEIALAESGEGPYLRASSLRLLGDVNQIQSEYDSARRSYEEALAIYRQIGHLLGEARALNSLGNIDYQQDQHDSARQYYEKALKIYRQIGRLSQEAYLESQLEKIKED